MVVRKNGAHSWLRSDDRWSVHSAQVEAGRGFEETVSDDSRGEAAVNVANFSAGVRPLRAMEKRS